MCSKHFSHTWVLDLGTCYPHLVSWTDKSACYLHLVTLKLSSTCTSPLKQGRHTRSLTRLADTIFNTADPLQHHYVQCNIADFWNEHGAHTTIPFDEHIPYLHVALLCEFYWHILSSCESWCDTEVELYMNITIEACLHARSLTRLARKRNCAPFNTAHTRPFKACTLFNTTGMHAL